MISADVFKVIGVCPMQYVGVAALLATLMASGGESLHEHLLLARTPGGTVIVGVKQRTEGQPSLGS